VFDGLVRTLLDRFFLFPVRLRVRWRNRHRLRVWENAVTSIRHIYERSSEFGLAHHRRIYNVALYVLLLDHDLASLGADMVSATNEWRRKFIARQLATILYEAIEDLPALLGRDFRSSLAAVGLDDAGIKELNTIMGQLNTFKRDHSKELQHLRNFAGAHRDHDAGAQLRILDELVPLAVFELGAQFYGPVGQLVDWLTKLTAATGRIEVLLQQYIDKGQPSNKRIRLTRPG
jgi:hypothetical protein